MEAPTFVKEGLRTFVNGGVALLSLAAIGHAQVPVAEFSGTPLSGTPTLTVDFTDLSTGAVVDWLWDFGDGGSSTEQHPSYDYDFAGTYTVSLTVSGPEGSDTETKLDYVTVSEPAPVAEFSAAPLAGVVPLAVDFTNLSTGAVTALQWDFGDDSPISTTLNPTHVYTEPGSYTVTLLVIGPGGFDNEIKEDLIRVDLPVGIADGSFELQSAGALPAAPWIVASGAGHRIQPDGSMGLATDNELPTAGLHWAEVSAEGTVNATPPSIPGGTGTGPSGAAGIEQVFLFDPGRPALFFQAAFLLDGVPASAGANDFMSVDITDGTTSHNLFYKDSFASFPNVSSRYGLPMTATELHWANLATLFPGADASTALTVSVLVGNGGDGLQPSRGYIDEVCVAPVASAQFRNGTGVNPALYTATPVALGENWSADVHAAQVSGASLSLILGYAAPATGPLLPQGELLVQVGTPRLFALQQVSNGVRDFFTVPVPVDLSILGVPLTTQAAVLGGGTTVLGNAADVPVGFAPPDTPPVAAYTAGPTSGSAPLTVFFVSQSSGSISSGTWDFGDGGASTLQNPSHTFTMPGSYTVTLIVEGPGGFDIEAKVALIDVQ